MSNWIFKIAESLDKMSEGAKKVKENCANDLAQNYYDLALKHINEEDSLENRIFVYSCAFHTTLYSTSSELTCSAQKILNMLTLKMTIEQMEKAKRSDPADLLSEIANKKLEKIGLRF